MAKVLITIEFDTVTKKSVIVGDAGTPSVAVKTVTAKAPAKKAKAKAIVSAEGEKVPGIIKCLKSSVKLNGELLDALSLTVGESVAVRAEEVNGETVMVIGSLDAFGLKRGNKIGKTFSLTSKATAEKLSEFGENFKAVLLPDYVPTIAKLVPTDDVPVVKKKTTVKKSAPAQPIGDLDETVKAIADKVDDILSGDNDSIDEGLDNFILDDEDDGEDVNFDLNFSVDL